MKVYRLIQFEGTALDLDKQIRRCVNGTYQPGAVKITATAVEPRIVEGVPMLVHALQLASTSEWQPPAERKPAAGAATGRTGSPFSFSVATDFIERIDDLLESGDYDWAADTLSGIRETVERIGQVTAPQERAVDNIEAARRER